MKYLQTPWVDQYGQTFNAHVFAGVKIPQLIPNYGWSKGSISFASYKDETTFDKQPIIREIDMPLQAFDNGVFTTDLDILAQFFYDRKAGIPGFETAIEMETQD